MWNSITSQRLPRGLVSLTVLSLGIAAAVTSSPALADEVSGAVYVLSNSAAGNKVLIYGRHENGELTYSGSVPTGGKGTITPPPPNGAPGIDPLGSQGSLVYHDGLLIAVNAGSNDISLFRAEDDELTLLDRVPSGGVMPTSVTMLGGLVYVQNAGGTPNISGFFLDAWRRRLSPLQDSTVPLPGGTSAGPGEVSFAAHGEVLVVTEKGTNLIDTFRLDWRGRPTLASSTASGGNTPFGFSVTHSKNLIVADAGSGAVSSYKLREDGSLQTIDAAVSLNGQTASCWLVTTANGRFAFTGDAGSEAISALSVSPRRCLRGLPRRPTAQHLIWDSLKMAASSMYEALKGQTHPCQVRSRASRSGRTDRLLRSTPSPICQQAQTVSPCVDVA
jgi:6-phosphogluconolactonase